MSDAEDSIKVLFLGLDNAGKSSIIVSLRREFSRLADLKPTRGVQIRTFKFLGMKIAEWDLGGQRLYRKVYMKTRHERTFGGTEIAIYIIDAQDKSRMEENLEYLQGIVNQFRLLEIAPPIYIFFHKYDPVDIIGSQVEVNNYSLELRNKIKETIHYPNMNFYRTSIYDLKTIIIAMSKILLSRNPKAIVLEEVIKEFAYKLESEGLEIIDDNSLIIGSYYKNEQTKNLMNSVTPLFLEVNDILERAEVKVPYSEEIEEHNDEMLIRRFQRFFLFKKFRIGAEGTYFYFLGCKKDAAFHREDLDTFIQLIKESI